MVKNKIRQAIPRNNEFGLIMNCTEKTHVIDITAL